MTSVSSHVSRLQVLMGKKAPFAISIYSNFIFHEIFLRLAHQKFYYRVFIVLFDIRYIKLFNKVNSCVVIGYANHQVKGSSLSFCCLQKGPERRRLWLAAINQKNYDPPQDSDVQVCGLKVAWYQTAIFFKKLDSTQYLT